MHEPLATWTARIWAEYRAGNLTRAARDVVLTLHTFRGGGGTAWPSHATLAERAGCCVRTVQRALALAQRLGLVDWCERRVKAAWRWLRTANLYRFLAPEGPVQAAARLKPTTGQNARREESPSKKAALEQMLQAAAAVPDLLALRRAAIEGRFAVATVKTPPGVFAERADMYQPYGGGYR
jgi:hypothetical protein